MLKRDKIIYTAIITAALLVAAILVKPKSTVSPEPMNGHATDSINYQPSTITLFFAGDIMLSRNVADKIYKAGDFSLPFKNVLEQISQSDISFANLESPFNDEGRHFVPNSLAFNADPKSVAGLTAAGFDVLATANNHSLDQGQEGLNFTYALLKAHDILPVGTGANCHEGVLITQDETKFGFLAYSYAAFNDGGPPRLDGESRLGEKSNPLVCNWNDTASVAQDIQSLKLKANFVIVSAHMGTEYQRKPDAVNVERVHQAIEAGADLFVGHHPHWIQTIEQYKGKWIFYSLGNFVFDQMWSQETREGLTVTITFEKEKIKKIELKPVIIEDYCCPRWANEEESLAILKKIGLTNAILVDKND